MALAVEEDVALDPVDIGFLGASAVVAGLDGVADPIEQAGVRGLRRTPLLAHPRDAAARGPRRMGASRGCLPDGHVLEGNIRDRHQAPQGPQSDTPDGLDRSRARLWPAPKGG